MTLKEVIRQQQTECQTEHHAQEAGNHKAVVENKFADFGRTRAVKINRRDNRTVVRDEEIAVHRDKRADDNRSGNAQRNTDGEQRCNGRPLAVDQDGQNEQGKRKSPRRGFDQNATRFL